MLHNILLAVGSLLFASFFFSPHASALEAGDIVVRVNPVSQEVELTPGETTTAELLVQNVGRNGFHFSLLTKPYQVTDDSYDPDFSTENSYTKLHNWIVFDQTDYYLEPNSEAVVTFRIDTPLDVPAGGQYAAVVVETRDTVDVNSDIQTINQVASLLHAHVAGETEEAGLLMAHSIPSLLFGSPVNASVSVKNDGNIDFRLHHTITVRNFFTNDVVIDPETIDANGITPVNANLSVLPASTRYNQLSWDGSPQLGLFKVEQTITFLDQNYTFHATVFLCPFWLLALVLFFIVLMIFWVFLRVRSHRKRRPRVF